MRGLDPVAQTMFAVPDVVTYSGRGYKQILFQNRIILATGQWLVDDVRCGFRMGRFLWRTEFGGNTIYAWRAEAGRLTSGTERSASMIDNTFNAYSHVTLLFARDSAPRSLFENAVKWTSLAHTGFINVNCCVPGSPYESGGWIALVVQCLDGTLSTYLSGLDYEQADLDAPFFGLEEKETASSGPGKQRQQRLTEKQQVASQQSQINKYDGRSALISPSFAEIANSKGISRFVLGNLHLNELWRRFVSAAFMARNVVSCYAPLIKSDNGAVYFGICPEDVAISVNGMSHSAGPRSLVLKLENPRGVSDKERERREKSGEIKPLHFVRPTEAQINLARCIFRNEFYELHRVGFCGALGQKANAADPYTFCFGKKQDDNPQSFVFEDKEVYPLLAQSCAYVPLFALHPAVYNQYASKASDPVWRLAFFKHVMYHQLKVLLKSMFYRMGLCMTAIVSPGQPGTSHFL